MMYEYINPLPQVVKDERNLQEFFRKFQIVPYYGSSDSTSHSTLRTISDFCKFSASFNASSKMINDFAFPQMFKIVFSENSFIENEKQELSVTNPIAQDFVNELQNLGIKPIVFSKISKSMNRDLQECGNAYLHIKRVQVGDIVNYTFCEIEYKNAAYLLDIKSKEKYIITTNSWDLNYMSKFPPTILTASYENDFKFTKTSAGVEETILHIAKDKKESSYYGSGIGDKFLLSLYTEFCNSEFLTKVALSEVLSKYLIAVERPQGFNFDETIADKDDITRVVKKTYFDKIVDTIKTFYTNAGDKKQTKSIGVIEYPNGTKEPKILEFAVNRDTNFSQFSRETVANEITSGLGWDRQLTGAQQTKGTIGSGILADLYICKNTTTIEPIQIEFENIWNSILNYVEDRDLPNYKQYGIRFSKPILKLIEGLKMVRHGENIAK